MIQLSFYLAELFPKPMLSASMTKLDESKKLTLSCSINGFQGANFSIVRKSSSGDILLKNSEVFEIKVTVNDTGSYTCKAEVKGIVKESKPVRINVYGELIQRLRTTRVGGGSKPEAYK